MRDKIYKMYLGGGTVVPHKGTIKCLEVLVYGKGVSMVGGPSMEGQIPCKCTSPTFCGTPDLHREVCSLDLFYDVEAH